jgi:uncharacterized protein (TIGR03086 family)
MPSEQVVTPTRQLDRAFASTRAVLAQVQPGQLAAPTPCASWDVRALITHFVGTARWLAATVSGVDEVPSENIAAAGFLVSYDESIRAALAAVQPPGTLTGTIRLPFGEFSGADLIRLAARDQFTHGWDLARAIGLHTDLDPELAGELLILARTEITEAYRGPDGVAFFGPAVDALASASPADRLAAFLGRPV